MAPKRKATLAQTVTVDAEAVTLSRRKRPRRSTQTVKVEAIESIPETKSEINLPEKPAKVRTARKTTRASGPSEEDEAGKDEEALSAERGARRPPPVNSDELPLPWSGRLGYVRCFCFLLQGQHHDIN